LFATRREPEDVALLLEMLAKVEKPDVVVHHDAALLESGLIQDAADAAERFSHHGNQHVHEDKLDQEGRTEEEDYGGDVVSACDAAIVVVENIVVSLEVSKSREIRVDESVCWAPTDDV